MLTSLHPKVRPLLLLLAACALPVSGVFAGTAATDTKDKNPVETVLDDMTPLNTLNIEGSYVGKSDFHTHTVNDQSQEETQESFEYGHRFKLFGHTYLRLGATYERFDFNTTSAPVPSGLQSITGVVGVEYVVNGKTGLFITSKPGVYFSDDHSISTANFDFPTNIGGIVPLSKKFYLLLGVHTSILAHYPVFPIVGAVWLISDNLRLEAIPPTPRLIYSVNDKVDLFVGGEILGDAYARDATNYKAPEDKRFGGANGVIDYSEYRTGGGLVFHPCKNVDIDLSGGWVLERSFNYYRGDSGHRKSFDTTGAPYAKLAISAEF